MARSQRSLKGMIQLVDIKVFGSRDEWLKGRASKIGGSDASAIIGLNPYRTNVELWKIKTGQMIPEDISEQPYVKYGTNAEYHLRELFKLDFPEYAVAYEENNMFTNDKFPWAHASLDGWIADQNGRMGILEIKTTNILQSMQKEKWKDRIPDNYYVQILHYLLVTEFDFAILKAQMKYDFGGEIRLQTQHYKIERADVLVDLEFLEHSEREFWQHVQEKKCPALVLPSF